MVYFYLLVRRDLLLVIRHPADLLNPLVFFLLIITLFPLGLSPQPEVLKQVAAGLVWIAALLATLLSLNLMYKSDYADGSMEQLLSSAQPAWLLVLAKITVHWLVSGLPLVLLSPLVAAMLFLPVDIIPTLMLTLLLGTPALSLWGSVGAALVVGLKNADILISLLILPLYVPTLLLGTIAIERASLGQPVSAYLALLGALLILACLVAPWASGAALKLSQMHH